MAKIWMDGVDVMLHADGYLTLQKGTEFDAGEDLAPVLVEFMLAEKMPISRYAVYMPEARKLPEGEKAYPFAAVQREWKKHGNAVVLASRFGKPYLLIAPQKATTPTKRKAVLTKLSRNK